MDCRFFSKITKDFIFNKINDKKVLSEYIEHAEECEECREELEILYSMHRALGDIMGPYGDDENSDYNMELEQLINIYNDMIETDKVFSRIRWAVLIFAILSVAAMIYYYYSYIV